MKKIFATIFILTIFISSCSPSISPTPSESAPIATATQAPPTVTATEIPSTPASTAVPTLSLPVSQLTPVPLSNTKITAENAKDLQEIARYYGQINYFAKVTKDRKFLFILDPDGLTKYDYSSMESVAYIELANSVSDLQISNDGNWLMINNNWLLDLKNDKEPMLYVLSEKIDLLNFYSKTFSLSPDGSLILLEELKCYDTCNNKFQIISTEDFKVLHVSSGVSYQYLPTFSSDGKYFALVDMQIEAHPDGSTNPSGASVGVWTTKDFTKVLSARVNYPFYVTDLAFSEDDSLLAIAQNTTIDIIDVIPSDSKTTIDGLCESSQRKVMFAPSLPLRLLERSDCDSGVWTKSESTAAFSIRDVPDFSRIVFDEKGDYKAVPYTQPADPNIKSYYQEDYFAFLNDDVLGFRHPDIETSDTHSCNLFLADGSFDCQSHAPEYNGGRILGKDVILATDGKYYGYVVGKDSVDIYSSDDPGQVYYSIPFRDFVFDLLALDPTNDIVIYNIGITSRTNRVIIQDMKNDRILEKWEGETYLSSIVFSENKKLAGICQKNGYNNNPNADRLLIFDLSEKRVAYKMDFTCGGAALGLSDDGRKLAVEYSYLPNSTAATYATRVMVLNTTSPNEKQYFDLDSFFFKAVAFSPDGSILAVVCGGSEICFYDVTTANKIYQLKAHSYITNLAFSKDGSLLATSSNWGLISLWAVPPFTGDQIRIQSTSPSSYNPNFYWNFNQDGNFEGFGAEDWQSSGFEKMKVENGYLSAVVTSPGTFLYSNEGLDIDSKKFNRIAIRMRVSDGETAQLYFRHRNDDMAESMSRVFETQPGTEFKTYVIDLGDFSNWRGSIYQLRLDPSRDAVGATVEIDYIHLLPPGLSWNFDESGNLEGWDNWGELDNVDVQGGYLSAKSIGSDPQIYSSEGLGIDANKFGHIEIRMRVSAGDSAQLFFRNDNNDLSENKSIIFPIESGTEFKTYILDMSKVAAWKNIIYQLRLDPTSDVNGATIEIDYINLLP